MLLFIIWNLSFQNNFAFPIDLKVGYNQRKKVVCVMKKRLLALLLAMSIIPLLMACNKDNINDDNQLAQTKTDQTTKKSDKETSHSDITETKISKEQAKHIALKDAGFTEKEVTLLTVEQDIDDGVTEFEVEFTKDATEYNYTINADTGKIISKETEDVND